MRGTRALRVRILYPHGIIPAYAGNTIRLRSRRLLLGDHPRVCGEHEIAALMESGGTGSSPRMRGTLGDSLVLVVRRGIIPAYAGNTTCPAFLLSSHGDHPRVCGEH